MPGPVADLTALWHHALQSFMRVLQPERLLRRYYLNFRKVLAADGSALELLSQLDSHLTGENPADIHRIRICCHEATEAVRDMVWNLQQMNPVAFRKLPPQLECLTQEIARCLTKPIVDSGPPYILTLEQAAGHPRRAGGKAANLSTAGHNGINIPRGFVITANGWHLFARDNGLDTEISTLFQGAHINDPAALVRIAGVMQERIMAAPVPPILQAAIQEAVASLAPAGLFAVRSSALAEDGEISFAGQYASELDVAPADVVSAYRQVLAGKYCPRAIAYRLFHGLTDAETAMAALVVPMLAPTVSGVIYTRDPSPRAEGESLGVYAVAGLAESLVDGSQTPEKYHLSRTSRHIYSCEQQGSTDTLLNTDELLQLKTLGLQLEQVFGCPQDIEWAIDDTGLTVLQCRKLHQQTDPPPAHVPAVDHDRLLYADLHCAAPGISCGTVFFAATGKAFHTIPHGAVVLTPTLRPSLSQFLDRIAGVIALSGSRASHFAAVARERGVPVLVGNGVNLQVGDLVTVDAASGRIFSGCLASILHDGAGATAHVFPADTFARLASCTTRLNLTNSDAETFTPDNCQSLHDLVRFCHEMSVREMFTFGDRQKRGLGKTKRLSTSLPLAMYVLDLRSRQMHSDSISVENLASQPMTAFWRGLTDERIAWDKNLIHVDWEQFDQVSGGIFSLDSRFLASYAIVSEDYLHLDIRFGYHFSIVDALCSENTGLNYLNFKFKGGGAAQEQRLFRLEFLDKVLTAYGFDITVQGDALNASFSRAPLQETEHALTRLGLLLAFTRMLDMRLTSSTHAQTEAENYLSFFD